MIEKLNLSKLFSLRVDYMKRFVLWGYENFWLKKISPNNKAFSDSDTKAYTF